MTDGILTVDYSDAVAGDSIFYQVTATDSVGNVVTDVFEITLSDVENYATWRAANFSGADASNELISGPEADPNSDGISNLQAFAQGYSAADVVSCSFRERRGDTPKKTQSSSPSAIAVIWEEPEWWWSEAETSSPGAGLLSP